MKRKLIFLFFALLLCITLAVSVSAEGVYADDDLQYETTDTEELGVGENLLVSLAVGVGIGVIVAFSLKRQLKSVSRQNQANAYIKQGSMRITQSDDHFLYSNVTRTPKQRSNSRS